MTTYYCICVPHKKLLFWKKNKVLATTCGAMHHLSQYWLILLAVCSDLSPLALSLDQSMSDLLVQTLFSCMLRKESLWSIIKFSDHYIKTVVWLFTPVFYRAPIVLNMMIYYLQVILNRLIFLQQKINPDDDKVPLSIDNRWLYLNIAPLSQWSLLCRTSHETPAIFLSEGICSEC